MPDRRGLRPGQLQGAPGEAYYGDGDTVFATTRVTIANTAKTMNIAEQFTFWGHKLIEVRVHVCDGPKT